jgi:hypothetical protein
MSVTQVFPSFVMLSLTCVFVRDGLPSVDMWFDRGEDRCCSLSMVGMVETVGFHHVMCFVLLKSAKDRILGVDPQDNMPYLRSGWFINHRKSFIRFSYVLCAFTYRIVELVFVLSYIRSCVWGSIEYSGTQCGDYYMIPWRLTALIRWKILGSAVDVVSEALSMHVTPPAIQTAVVPAWVIVLLGPRNPPRTYTGIVGPSLPDFTIAHCVDYMLCYRLIRRPKSILQDSPKIYGTCLHLYNCIWVVLPVPRLNIAFLSQVIMRYRYSASLPLSLGFDNPRNTLRWKLL